MNLRLGSTLLGGALFLAASTAAAQPALAPAALPPLALAPLAPTALTWAPGVPPPARTNTSLMVTGIVLTAAGVAMTTGGVLWGVTSGPCSEDVCGYQIFAPLLIGVGIPHILVGVPLWIGGAVPPDPRYRSNGARSAGIFLTSLASASLVVGLTAILLDPTGRNPKYSSGENLAVGIPAAAISAAEAAVGVPLWVVGSRPPTSVASIPDWAVPTFTPGLGSGSLRWTF